MSQGVTEFTENLTVPTTLFTQFPRSLSTAWWGARQVGIIPILLMNTLRLKEFR